MKECFASKRFGNDMLATIEQANEIIEEYAKAGFDLTLRQLFYQFVARGLISNSDKEYKKLGSAINDARLAGLIDWDSISDRTRFIRERPSWTTPHEIVVGAARQFHLYRWRGQVQAVEVWIEKDALIGVIEGVCKNLDVVCLSCRGYVSQSTMYEASKRMLKYDSEGRKVTVLHLGDHDPSGIDMTRDINERLNMFTGDVGMVTVDRIALTMNQVRQLNPPPNPAKLTDARADDYIAAFGDKSWELDAIDPKKLVDLVKFNVEKFIDWQKWGEVETQEREDQTQIMKLGANVRGH